MIQGRSTPVG